MNGQGLARVYRRRVFQKNEKEEKKKKIRFRVLEV